MLSRKICDNQQLLKIAAENPQRKQGVKKIPKTNSHKSKEGVAENPISA